jgi:NADH-quinone oxidoreductase subunit J
VNLPEISPNLIGFGLIALLAMASAVGVIVFPNAIRAALCLVVNFFMIAFLYFTLNAEMLGITQVVVYTGAIMVLFLFVIMLLNLGSLPILEEKLDLRRLGAGLLGLLMFGAISFTVLLPLREISDVQSPSLAGTPMAVGRTLFTLYLYPFEIASVLLLVGIVGSILLAKRRI